MTNKSIAKVLKKHCKYTKPSYILMEVMHTCTMKNTFSIHNSKVSPFKILKLQNELQRQDTAS